LSTRQSYSGGCWPAKTCDERWWTNANGYKIKLFSYSMIDVMHDTIRIYNLQEVYIRTIPRPMLPSTFVAGYNTTHHDPQKYFDSLSDDARPQDGLMCGERLHQDLYLPKKNSTYHYQRLKKKINCRNCRRTFPISEGWDLIASLVSTGRLGPVEGSCSPVSRGG
jgi:hypothetical protein